MSPAVSVPDVDLRNVLERTLSEGGVGTLRTIRRRPSEYRTSFPLEELDLTLDDGSALPLIFKDLDWKGLSSDGRLAKPEFLYDPQREPAMYESVLALAAVDSPRYYGSVVDPERDRYWLFVERVEGRELYQVGDRRLWEEAARRLGEMHLRLTDDLTDHVQAGRLLDYDEQFYRRWLERAREFAEAPGQAAERGRALEGLAERYELVVEGLLDLPKTVIHGEFYASNVLVSGDIPTLRVCPVDWELAAAAPGLIDLAALVSGGWSDEDREAIVAAYRSVVGPAVFTREQLDLCRLHLAIQWLGWAPPTWTPPDGQRHDWLGEALALADELDLR